jgi:hypothetical protein
MKKVDVIDIGECVICDSCNEDYTASDEKGGILFCSSAFCPKCAPRMTSLAKQYNEEEYITDRARPGETFKDFCIRLRDGNNTITITTF